MVETNVGCPYCGLGLDIDLSKGTFVCSDQCPHLFYAFGNVPYSSIKWEHPLLEGLIPALEESEDLRSLRKLKEDHPKRTPEGKALKRAISRLEREERGVWERKCPKVDEEAIDEFLFDLVMGGKSGQDARRPSVSAEVQWDAGEEDEEDWSVYALFVADSEPFLRELVQNFPTS